MCLLLVLFLQFNNMVNETRHSSTEVPFDYCYDIRSFIRTNSPVFVCFVFCNPAGTDFQFKCSANQTELTIPAVTLVMSGGASFNVTNPIVVVQLVVSMPPFV